MTVKIFLTGATGYIGGDILAGISEVHPDWQIRALIRGEDKANIVAAAYPNIHIVKGDLDSADILEQEARDADIIYHAADCDHVGAARAIAKGLSQRTSERPGWWIHNSGSGILAWQDAREGKYGFHRLNEYDDLENLSKVHSIPDDAVHRPVDKIVFEANEKNPEGCKTAIVAPPTIYATGRGPCSRRSIQVNALARAMLLQKKGLKVNAGENVWHQVHVADLTNVYIALGEAAVNGGGDATWGHEGYYFAENGPFKWGDVAASLAKIAKDKGLIASADLHPIDAETADQYDDTYGFGSYLWGTNSIGYAHRARKLLGWEPKQPGIFDLLPSILDGEAKRLNL